ncbi:MAG: hypothetical protein DHS20C18_48930 [Saprospiraceae bacterium]|nr:MAG: hypothetical protein DHS20C18_48930 [Saprospiraceae bacterium]
MKNEDIYKKAKKRVQAKKGFFYHLLAYAFTVGMLYAIMHFEKNGEILPVIIVALSWGIGLATHYFKTFGTEHLDFLGINSNWEEEELEKEIKRLERKRELQERISKEKSLLDDSEDLRLKEIEKKPLQGDFD